MMIHFFLLGPDGTHVPLEGGQDQKGLFFKLETFFILIYLMFETASFY